MRRFNRKRLTISLVLFSLVAILMILISMDVFTLSRYETQVSSEHSLSTAVYLLKDTYNTLTIKLPDVVPDNHQYEYRFSVSNYTATEHSDTNLKYRIHIRTTTNTEIEYDLIDNWEVNDGQSVVISNATSQDSYGTYFRHILTGYKTMLYTEDKTDQYTIVFTFSDDFEDAKYSEIAEYIEVNIESSQVLQSDT